MIYLLSWFASLILAKIYFGLKVYGAENVPKKGPFILASNHESNADPFILGVSLPCTRWFSFLAKKELFEGKFNGWYFRKLHVIPLDRGEADPGAIKKVIDILKSGKPMMLFPEGTRSLGRGLQPGKPGIGFIAAKTRVPVVPAYIAGAYKAVPEGLGSINKSRVNVLFGKPLYFTDIDPKNKDSYRKISDTIMDHIARLKKENAGSIS